MSESATIAPQAFAKSNEPPPSDRLALEIDGLTEEARMWLDGEPIENQAQANDLTLIVTSLRKYHKEADGERVLENKPFDDGKKASQKKWNPILKKADTAIKTGKAAIAKFLAAEQAKLIEQSRIAAQAAAAAEAALREQEKVADIANLEDQESLEADREQVKRAQASAKFLSTATAKSKGTGRAMSLRTYYDAKVEDHDALLSWIYENDIEWLHSKIAEYAQSKVSVSKQDFAGVKAVSRQVAA